MKKTFLLFCFITGLAYTSYAQANICNAIGALTEEANTKFDGIAGDSLPSVNGEKRAASKYVIDGSSACYIRYTSYIGNEWYAEFGNFNTEEEATTKLKSLQDQLQVCSSKLEFIEHKFYTTDLPQYYIKENFDGGFHIYKEELGIYQNNDKKYIPYIKVPEDAVAVTYSMLTNEPDTSLFAREINYVMKEAGNKFKNIIGEKTPDGFIVSIYKTTFCITNAVYCTIQDNMMAKEYRAYAATNIEEAEADKAVLNLSNSVAYVLGKPYVWSKLKDGTGTAFTELKKAGMNDYSSVVVEKVDIGKNKYDVVLIIKKP